MLYHEDGSEVKGPPKGKQIRAARGNKKLGYLGHPKIKRAYVKIGMSADEQAEFIKCRNDPVYFMRAYMKIVNVDGGLIPFDMYDFQEEMIRCIHDNRFSTVCCARQVGKTITITGYLLWFAIFNTHKNIGILANKKKNATKALARLKLAYEKLPMWLQQGVISWNKGDIELENGSIIGTFASDSEGARGESFSFLFVDEVAFIDTTTWDEFYKSSYPTISSGKTSKIALVSTPNGLNHFYTLHNNARKGKNTYASYEVRWDSVPGRDEEWKQETIANTSEEDFLQEHEIEFLGNSLTLVPAAALRKLESEPVVALNEKFKVIEQPKDGHKYFISVDVGHGLGQDHTVINIFDITEYPYKQVAQWRDNKTSVLVLPNLIEYYGNMYNTAYVLVETNDIGVGVVQTLNWEFEYPHIISTRSGSSTKSKLGMRTTTKTKAIGCNRLKDMVVSQKLLPTTEEAINELYAFQEKGKSYEAAYGFDDIVMSMVNFAYYASTPQFSMIFDRNFGNDFAKDHYNEALETLTPAPMIDNGINREDAFFEENGYYDGNSDKGLRS